MIEDDLICAYAVLGHHFQELTRIGLWPLSMSLHKASTKGVLQKLEKYKPCTQTYCGCSSLVLSPKVKSIVQDFSVQRGLCLECYRNGKYSPSSGNCMARPPEFCERADEE